MTAFLGKVSLCLIKFTKENAYFCFHLNKGFCQRGSYVAREKHVRYLWNFPYYYYKMVAELGLTSLR